MAVMSVEELYEKYIKPRSIGERLRLVEITTRELANRDTVVLAEKEKPKRSIMELHGLGAELWKDMDTEQYVHQLREEWDRRS